MTEVSVAHAPEVPEETRTVLRGLMQEMHRDLEKRERIAAHTSNRLKWGMWLMALIAAIVGAALFYLIAQMDGRMAVMSGQMRAMTASVGDMTRSVSGIQTKMNDMTAYMQAMNSHLGHVTTDLTGVPDMAGNLASMNATLTRMSRNTGAMQSAVQGMRYDTTRMARPFSFMDRFVP
jgi:hypothetical protein